MPPAYTFYRSGSAKQPLKMAGSGLIAKGTDTRKSNTEPVTRDAKYAKPKFAKAKYAKATIANANFDEARCVESLS